MLIPSIDLQNGSVVQLVQGEKLAIKADDAEPWIQTFSRFPRVQHGPQQANGGTYGQVYRERHQLVGTNRKKVPWGEKKIGSTHVA